MFAHVMKAECGGVCVDRGKSQDCGPAAWYDPDTHEVAQDTHGKQTECLCV